VGLGLPVDHVGSQGMAGAVGPGPLPFMLVSGSWRELWSWGCWAAMLVPRAWPCWFPGHGHVGTRGMAEAVGLGLQGGHVCSRGMAGAVGPRLLGRHICSQGKAGAVDPGVLTCMLVPGARRELWA